MALLSQLMRTAAITGRPDQVHAWFATRQGGRWADQMVAGAMPARGTHAPEPPPEPRKEDPAQTLRELTDLHEQGVLSDAELERLRARLGV
jgi:hypothetical protein